ncbi:MAG: hypothetical protein K0B87_07235, partial [Candidatus Syntrophosphaera sp.]|nr:hypothetical protein [Candidatus Syntrophosphaera sp.]
ALFIRADPRETKKNKEENMDCDLIKALARELATKVNKVVDIPLVGEEDEQSFFELIILILLELIFAKLGFELKVEK